MTAHSDLIAELRKRLVEYKYIEFQEIPATTGTRPVRRSFPVCGKSRARQPLDAPARSTGMIYLEGKTLKRIALPATYKIFLLIFPFVFITACAPGTVNTPVPKDSVVHWDASPTTLIVRSYTGPASGVTYDLNYYIPESQVWGDGRIIWVEDDHIHPRRVLIGQLTADQLKSLLQRMVDAGFFDWDDRYGIGGSTHTGDHLSAAINGRTKEVSDYGNSGMRAPRAYFELIEFLNQGAGAAGSDFIPTRGYLTARCWSPIEEIALSAQWSDAAAGFSLDQVGSGRYLEGKTLSFAWQTINQHPTAPVYVTSNDQTCVIMVQVPGVSFYEPPLNPPVTQ